VSTMRTKASPSKSSDEPSATLHETMQKIKDLYEKETVRKLIISVLTVEEPLITRKLEWSVEKQTESDNLSETVLKIDHGWETVRYMYS
jgi:hypothetical protein